MSTNKPRVRLMSEQSPSKGMSSNVKQLFDAIHEGLQKHAIDPIMGHIRSLNSRVKALEEYGARMNALEHRIKSLEQRMGVGE